MQNPSHVDKPDLLWVVCVAVYETAIDAQSAGQRINGKRADTCIVVSGGHHE